MQNRYEVITSRQNPFIKTVARLSDRKTRESEGLFRFDGRKLLGEALVSGVNLSAVLLRESSAEAIFSACAIPASVRTILLPDALFDQISEENAPEGVISVAKKLKNLHKTVEKNENDAFAEALPHTRLLCLESVRDPGNLGTVVRSAAAFGIEYLLLSADCADLYHPRALRAAMGTAFRQKVYFLKDFAGVVKALAEKRRVFALALDDTATRLGDCFLPRDAAFIVGNEGHGVSPEVLSLSTDRLFIPMEKGVESLNAAIAASVLLYRLYTEEA